MEISLTIQGLSIIILCIVYFHQWKTIDKVRDEFYSLYHDEWSLIRDLADKQGYKLQHKDGWYLEEKEDK